MLRVFRGISWIVLLEPGRKRIHESHETHERPRCGEHRRCAQSFEEGTETRETTESQAYRPRPSWYQSYTALSQRSCLPAAGLISLGLTARPIFSLLGPVDRVQFLRPQLPDVLRNTVERKKPSTSGESPA